MNYFLIFPVADKKIQDLMDRMNHLAIKENEIQEKFIKASGPGGQKVNKQHSAVQLKYKDWVVVARQERSQPLNRFLARRQLCELVDQALNGKESKEEITRARIKKNKAKKRRRAIKKSNSLEKDQTG